MKKRKPRSVIYPDARLKGIRGFFALVKEEPSWRPDPISAGTLRTLGIGPSKERNIIRALIFLGIIDGEGHPTAELDNLRKDFQPTLKRLLRKSYAGLFETVPSNRITEATLVRFFERAGYGRDTAEYQGALFVGLSNDAGLDLPNVGESFTRARFGKSPRS